MIEFTPLKFDSTLSFSIGLAVCALVVTSITAFMNNRHDFKMKQLEYANTAKKEKSQHEQEIFERYMLAVGACIQHNGEAELTEFRSRSALAMYSVPDDCIREDMLLLEQYMDFADVSGQKKCVELLAQITVALRSYYHRPGNHQDSNC